MIKTFKAIWDRANRWRIKEPQDKLDIHGKYREVFGTASGEVVLADICKRNFVFSSAFHPNPHESAHNEGRRVAALSILLFVNKDQNELIHETDTKPSSD
jgi:hypothetical protein